jgi:hypothetical protein
MAFARSPQGQRMIMEARRRYDTPRTASCCGRRSPACAGGVAPCSRGQNAATCSATKPAVVLGHVPDPHVAAEHLVLLVEAHAAVERAAAAAHEVRAAGHVDGELVVPVELRQQDGSVPATDTTGQRTPDTTDWVLTGGPPRQAAGPVPVRCRGGRGRPSA